MMLVASLIELPIAKPRMWQKHNSQSANFDKASVGVIWFRWRPLLGCSHIEMSRHQITGSNGHAAVVMRPAISNVEFSQFLELARVLVCFFKRLR
jgi:hypothetical protein